MSKKKIETDEQPQTMEEYLLSQLDTPAYLKDGTIATVNGKELTKQEAIDKVTEDAKALMKELDAYDELGNSLIEWYYNKFKAQE